MKDATPVKWCRAYFANQFFIVDLPLAYRHDTMRTRSTFLLTFLLLLSAWFQAVRAQCTTTVTTFPYNENFENTPGDWTPSSAVHWAWGTPVGKAVISAAASGSKCWIGGGLIGSSYSSSTSELMSPCFNFSGLANPEISFKVFWETELQFDGVTLQYTTDNGASWLTLGGDNSNNACLGIENWFNYSSINFLGSRPGWSGNIQTGGGNCLSGEGSGQWLTAKHNLANLAGAGNVIFRFVFGAGTICNGYDGFGLDDVRIAEAPPNNAAFTYTCGSNNTAQFNNSSLPCQEGWSWNFGDPASGSNNSSNDQNPSHVFSSPGTYTVSLLVDYGSGAQAIAPSQNITIIDVSTQNTNIRCNGEQNGAINVFVNPPGSYNFNWNTNPVQTSPSINNLSANIPYTVTVTATSGCTVTIPVTLTQPAVLLAAPVASAAKCGNDNGSITANVTGGIAAYAYTWSNGQTTSQISALAPGLYSLEVSDANGCVAPTVNNIRVEAVTKTLVPFLGPDTTICPGQTLLLKPGSFASYEWQDLSTAATYRVTATGNYFVAVTDTDGCKGSDTIHVTVDCKGIYFPSAFTPGSDLLNPVFSATGDLGSLKNFSLLVYNRYAQVIFTSSDPYQGWNGTFKGKDLETGAYVWIANYSLQGRQSTFKKGSILLIR